MAPRCKTAGPFLLYSWPKQCISIKIELWPSGHLQQRRDHAAKDEIPPDRRSVTKLRNHCQEVSVDCYLSMPNCRSSRTVRTAQIGGRRLSAAKVDRKLSPEQSDPGCLGSRAQSRSFGAS